MLLEDDRTKLIDNNVVSSKESILTVASLVEDKVRLLPKIHPDDVGKKCFVLDSDETLVHSSFRAVPGANFVLPVQVCLFPRYQKLSLVLTLFDTPMKHRLRM